jgi:RNA polymerase sigma factor (sigma-70 family)
VELALSPSNDAKFRGIFDAHFVEVQRYCVRRLSAADANDATSEVFLVAWRRIGAVPSGDEALPWLIGVARNVVRNVLRSNTRAVRLAAKASDHATEEHPSPESQVVMGAEFEEAQRALALLSDDDREVIRLRTWEELTAPQIATVFGCSTSAAEKRITRAWSRLSKAVERNRTVRPRELEKGGDDRGT